MFTGKTILNGGCSNQVNLTSRFVILNLEQSQLNSSRREIFGGSPLLRRWASHFWHEKQYLGGAAELLSYHCKTLLH